MGKLVDITGMEFGEWIVAGYSKAKKKWECKCSCGSVGFLTGTTLRKGRSSSCSACRGKNRLLDLKGEFIGRWYVVDYAGGSMWNCVCECGGEHKVIGKTLKNGESTGCAECKKGRHTDHGNKKFGSWTPIYHVVGSKWMCKCDCGAEEIRQIHSLMVANVPVCRECGFGLSKKAKVSPRTNLHGMSKSREYNSWCAMKSRCLNPKNPKTEYYMGRGIAVCQEWIDDFKAFYKHMGPRPEGRTLDRINNDGNYEPGNCKWSTIKEQANNRRITNRA